MAIKVIHLKLLVKESLGIIHLIIEKDINDSLEVEISNKYQNLNKIKTIFSAGLVWVWIKSLVNFELNHYLYISRLQREIKN